MNRSILQTAALIAHPTISADLDAFDPVTIRMAGDLLEKQSVSFLGLKRSYGDKLADSALAQHLERDEKRYMRERLEFERIRGRFAAAGIESMLFKSAGLFPAFHYLSSNLDVIVPDGRAAEAREILVGLGYTELINTEEPRKFLFRRFPGDGTTYAFHLHEVVGWGVPFLDNDALWTAARHPVDDPDILIPGPVQALQITTAHWFYEDKELSLGNMLMTAQAVTETRGALTEAAGAAARRGWEEGFWGALKVFDNAWISLYDSSLFADDDRARIDAGLQRARFVRNRLLPGVRLDCDVPAEIPFLLNKVVYYKKILADGGRSWGRKARDVLATLLWAVRWKLHIRPQKALLVSLSGCDGSGKTMQADRLAWVLDTCDLRHRRVWARGATSPAIGWMIRLGKFFAGRGGSDGSAADSKSELNEAEKFERRQEILASRPFARFVFSQLFAADLFWSYAVRVRLALLTGNVVVCDRYVYDAIADFALYTNTDPARPPQALRLIDVLAPTPRVRLLLDVTPEEALRRKPEEGTSEHIAAARGMLVGMADARDLTVLSPDAAADDIQRDIVAHVLGAFYKDYGTFLNGLLHSNPRQLNPPGQYN